MEDRKDNGWPGTRAMPGVLQAHPGWMAIAAAASEAAGEDGRPGRVDDAALSGQGGLLLEIASEQPEHARGLAAIAHALSKEICTACGGAGHPAVELRTGAPTTLCDRCRGTEHARRERPEWRQRDRGHELACGQAGPVVDDLIDDDELAALMEARFAPAEHRGWPRKMFSTEGCIVWTIGGAGWNGLLRAAFAVLLPLQCEGQARPFRIGQVKERLGALTIHGWPFDRFRQGVIDLLMCYSQRICIHCGQPGTLRDWPTVGWIRPECEACWATAPENTEGPERETSEE